MSDAAQAPSEKLRTDSDAEFDSNFAKFKAYIEKKKSAWLARNRSPSSTVYEVMCAEERARVDQRINAWKYYITPIAEAWWRRRGYRVIWPDDDAKPMQLERIKPA